MGQNWCNKCQRRHNTPVGRNCTRKPKAPAPPQVYQQGSTVSELPDQVNILQPPLLTTPTTSADDNMEDHDPEVTIKTAPAAESDSTLTARIDNLEGLMTRISENLLAIEKPKKSRHRHRSPSASSCSDSEESHPHRSKSTPSKLVSPFAYDCIFPEEDVRITGFEGVMLALFTTIDIFVDNGKDIDGLLSHGKFLAEKAVSDSYIPEAFVGFDKFLRGKASRKGFTAFDEVTESDKSKFFNLEHHKEVRALKDRVKKQNKKPKGICNRYNGENGCYARICNYAHRCSTCEMVSHPAYECKSNKLDKPRIK